MFADYQRLVIQDFEQKKAKNDLSIRLIHATPAKLKQECLEVYATRFEKKDENTIKGFFGERGAAPNYVQAIERCDTDKFRPLINYIRGTIINTDVRNIELLAWLINFEPRPWQFQRKYDTGETEIPEINLPRATEDYKEGDEEPIAYQTATATANKKTKGTTKRIAIPILVAAFVSISGYVFLIKPGLKTGNGVPESCMYWNVDHYEQISCNQKPGIDIMVIAYDSARFRNFKRIMTPDTITLNAKGKVWYIKRNSKLEYYTSAGRHPVHPDLMLRPITEHIIRTYILPGSGK